MCSSDLFRLMREERSRRVNHSHESECLHLLLQPHRIIRSQLKPRSSRSGKRTTPIRLEHRLQGAFSHIQAIPSLEPALTRVFYKERCKRNRTQSLSIHPSYQKSAKDVFHLSGPTLRSEPDCRKRDNCGAGTLLKMLLH